MKGLLNLVPVQSPPRMIVRARRMPSESEAAGEQAPAAVIVREISSAVMMADVGFRCCLADRHGSDERHQLPYRRQADQDVNDPGKGSILAAEQSCYEVKLEESDQKPIQATDNDQKKCDEVERAQFPLLRRLEAHPTTPAPERSRQLNKKPNVGCWHIDLPFECGATEVCEEGMVA